MPCLKSCIKKLRYNPYRDLLAGWLLVQYAMICIIGGSPDCLIMVWAIIFKKPLQETAEKETTMEDGIITSEFKQPKPLNPEVKDYELLPEEEKRDLEKLVMKIIKWTNRVNNPRS